MRVLKPAQRFNRVTEVNIAGLAALGVKGVILDLDNTLTEWKRQELCPEVAQWLADFSKYGIKACILSNGVENRVRPFALGRNLPYVAKARKPRRKGFLRAIKLLGTTTENTVVIGDQVFTDVWGGNRTGLRTILVRPLSRHEFIGTRLVRHLERWVLAEQPPRWRRLRFFRKKP
ncbi:MAG: YqeG family HAD IIIA-type phosphatase [Heliobacteriaceae bacterium]|nr:YqeG family HAD IIIA-type phosphatase [Heliobacteriaceae bacterium]MDD4587171.1 YqeG family HAD IIIA-type phosphatase [Heliobacteriaceae bacterium]